MMGVGGPSLFCSGSSVLAEVPVTARVSRLDKDAQTNDGCLHESARCGIRWPHLYQFHNFNMPDLSDCGGMCAGSLLERQRRLGVFTRLRAQMFSIIIIWLYRCLHELSSTRELRQVRLRFQSPRPPLAPRPLYASCKYHSLSPRADQSQYARWNRPPQSPNEWLDPAFAARRLPPFCRSHLHCSNAMGCHQEPRQSPLPPPLPVPSRRRTICTAHIPCKMSPESPHATQTPLLRWQCIWRCLASHARFPLLV